MDPFKGIWDAALSIHRDAIDIAAHYVVHPLDNDILLDYTGYSVSTESFAGHTTPPVDTASCIDSIAYAAVTDRLPEYIARPVDTVSVDRVARPVDSVSMLFHLLQVGSISYLDFQDLGCVEGSIIPVWTCSAAASDDAATYSLHAVHANGGTKKLAKRLAAERLMELIMGTNI